MSDDVALPAGYADPNLRRVAVAFLQQQMVDSSDADALEWVRSMPADAVIPDVMLQAVAVPVRGRDVVFLAAAVAGSGVPLRCIIEFSSSDLDAETVSHFQSGAVVTFKAVWRGADWDYTVDGLIVPP